MKSNLITRNTRVATLITAAGTNPKMKLYNGVESTSPAGTLLATLNITGALGTSKNGVLTFNQTVTQNNALHVPGSPTFMLITTSANVAVFTLGIPGDLTFTGGVSLGVDVTLGAGWTFTEGDNGQQAMGADPTTMAAYYAEMRLGFNIGNWLDAFIIGQPGGWWNQAQLEAARDEGGLTHLRIPVAFCAHANAAGVIEEAFLATYVDPMVTAALATFPRVILDMHSYLQMFNHHKWGDYPIETKFYTAAQHIVRLRAMWVQVATRYAALSSRLSFDLLNEPYAEVVSAANLNTTTPVGITTAEYHAMLPDLIGDIRGLGGLNATRVLWVETYALAATNTLKSMVASLASFDANVGISVHMYEPFAYTHQTTGTVVLSNYGLRMALWMVQYIKAWGVTNGRKMYIGESGANMTCNAASRLLYVQGIHDFCKKEGIPTSIWDWISDFRIYAADGSGWLSNMAPAVAGIPPPTALSIPVSMTTTDGILGGNFAPSAIWHFDSANKRVWWDANTGSAKTLAVKFPSVSVANGQTWSAFVRVHTNLSTFAVNAVSFDGTTNTTVKSGAQCTPPAGYVEAIVGADATTVLAMSFTIAAGAGAGEAIYEFWRES